MGRQRGVLVTVPVLKSAQRFAGCFIDFERPDHAQTVVRMDTSGGLRVHLDEALIECGALVAVPLVSRRSRNSGCVRRPATETIPPSGL
jgi:hypothetical protein